MIDTKKRDNKLEIAYASLELEGKPITVDDIADEMEVDPRTVRNYIQKHGGFVYEKGEGKKSIVVRKNE